MTRSPNTHGRKASSVTRRTLLAAAAGGAASSFLRGSARAEAEPLVVDVHCHNFNASDLPIAGFSAHVMPFLSDLSSELTDLPERLYRTIAEKVEAALNLAAPTAATELADLQSNPTAPWPAPVSAEPKADQIADAVADGADWLAAALRRKADVHQVLRRAAQVVNMISRSRAAITATLADTYPQVALFVPMLVDYDGWVGKGPAKSKLADQILVQGALARKTITTPLGANHSLVHPFVAFDPKRPDGLALVQTAVEQQGFIGVKVYPPVGFAPARNECLLSKQQPGKAIDDALDGLYAYCAKNDVPITTHCSTANEFGLGLRDLVEPRRWEPVLAKYPKLRLNLGHFGHAAGAESSRGFRACEAWIRQATALIDRYDNVYGDLSGSAFNGSPESAASYAKLLQIAFDRAPGKTTKRIMYGSDWWLNRFFDGAPTYLSTFRTQFAKSFPGRTELHADVLGANALRFLGFRDEGGARSANGERLASVYKSAGQPAPAWLGK
jgi:predicted TIM-barrel fold metal-dependent hydrolase